MCAWVGFLVGICNLRCTAAVYTRHRVCDTCATKEHRRQTTCQQRKPNPQPDPDAHQQHTVFQNDKAQTKVQEIPALQQTTPTLKSPPYNLRKPINHHTGIQGALADGILQLPLLEVLGPRRFRV